MSDHAVWCCHVDCKRCASIFARVAPSLGGHGFGPLHDNGYHIAYAGMFKPENPREPSLPRERMVGGKQMRELICHHIHFTLICGNTTMGGSLWSADMIERETAPVPV